MNKPATATFLNYFCSLITLFFLIGSLGLSAKAAPPTISSFSPASGAIGTLVTIQGLGLSGLTSFSIGGVQAIAVSGTATSLVGMVMPGAVTGAISLFSAAGTVVSTSIFTVLLTPFPALQQGAKMTGSGERGAGMLGLSVAVSADGNTAIAGAPIDNEVLGAAVIYIRIKGTWFQQGPKLVGLNSQGVSQQGNSVSISADGNTAIVGGNADNNSIGASWIYTRTGTTWTQQGPKLTATDGGQGSNQGYSVSMSADGNTVLVGGVADKGNTGASWIYSRSGTTWKQTGSKLVGAGATGAAFQGSSVNLSKDGLTAIVSGPQDNNGIGACWIYTKSSIGWIQQGPKLVGTGNIGNAFQGSSVALSADGNIAMVGGSGDNTSTGAVWVFTRSAGTWSQSGTKLAGSAIDVGQGTSISLSADGSTAIVGLGIKKGSVVYTRQGNNWSVQGSRLLGSGESGASNQGSSVALSSDGTTFIAGGYTDNSNTGAVWAFSPGPPTISSFSPSTGAVGTLVTINGTGLFGLSAFNIGGVAALAISNSGNTLVGMVMPGAVSGAISVTSGTGLAASTASFTVIPTLFPGSQQGVKMTGVGETGAGNLGITVAVSADGNTAIAGASNDNGGIGAAFIYVRSNGTWMQQGPKLTGNDAIGYSDQGLSVGISADGNTVIVSGVGDNGGTGASWVYTRKGTVWSQQGPKLTANDAITGTRQGYSVSMSADGNTVLVGGSSDAGNLAASWIYTRSGTTWTQAGKKLIGTGYVPNGFQGYSSSLSADGMTALVGSPVDSKNMGASWVFVKSSTGWVQQGPKLVGTGNIGNAWQGGSVALSADGNMALVGGARDNGNIGAAWIFTRTAGIWVQSGNKLVSEGSSLLGAGVSLSADGATAIIGTNSSDQTSSLIYTRNGTNRLEQVNKLIGSMGSIAVSLSADGTTLITGNMTDNGNKGALLAFIPGAPAISSFSPASGSVGSLVTISGTGLLGLTGFTLGGVPAITVSATNTKLVCMVMPGAVSGGISVTSGWGAATSAASFTVTPTSYQAHQQGTKMTGAGESGNGSLGFSVAVSADGNTAIAGAINDDSRKGASYIYVRSKGLWTQQGPRLTGSDAGYYSYQGNSVGISADGNTVIVGGFSDYSGKGASWIYTRTGTTWTQQGPKLTANDATLGAQQGFSVSISADGNTVLVGGFYDNSQIGASWIYSRSGTSWKQTGSKLVGTGAVGTSNQGSSVSLSADGSTALIGGSADNSGIGASWVFVKSSSGWVQQGAKLVGTGSIGSAYQGNSGALSADGNIALVGAFQDNGGNGAAWIFTRSAGSWIQSGNKLTSAGYYGQAKNISLSADGTTVVVSTTYQGQPISQLYHRNGNNWFVQPDKLLGSGGTGTGNFYSGNAVAMSSDGTTIITANRADDNGKGAIWAFMPGPPPPSISTSGTLTKMTGIYGTGSPKQTFTVSGLNLTAGILITAPAGFELSLNGSTYLNTITLGTIGTVTPTLVSIRLAARTHIGNYSGAILLSTNGASAISQATSASTQAPAVLFLTGDNQVSTYGAALPVLTYKSKGFVNNDTPDSLTKKPVLLTSAVQGSAAGKYTITLSGAADSNYTIQYTASFIAISKASLVLTALDVNKKYGTQLNDQTSSTAFSTTGLQNNETIGSVHITYGNGKSAADGAGVYKSSIQPSLATGGTALLSNYTLTYINGNIQVNALLPTITDLTASHITSTGVTLNASASDNGAWTTVVLKYGTDPLLKGALTAGFSTGHSPLSPGTGKTLFTSPLLGLRSGMTYYFQLSATNSVGTVLGSVASFTTLKASGSLASAGLPNQLAVGESSTAGNIVSPNNDGHNDTWFIKDIQNYPYNSVKVYDRLGRVIYSKSGYTNDWGATYHGQLVNEGTYYYSVDFGPGERKMKGFITVVRDH